MCRQLFILVDNFSDSTRQLMCGHQLADGIVNMNMTRPQCHVSSTASSVFRTQFVSVVVVMMTMFSFSFHSCCRFAKRVFDTNWSELHHSDSFTVAVDSSCSLLHTHAVTACFYTCSVID